MPNDHLYDPGDGTPIAIRAVNRDGTSISSGGGGGTSSTDDNAFIPGASSVTPIGGIVSSDDVDDGHVGAFAMLPNRQQKVTLYDSAGVEQDVGRVGHDTTGLGDGRKTVTTAGAAEALAGSTACKWVLITAETDNTGIVVVGSSSVVAALATRRGVPLSAGDTVSINIDNLADISLDVTVNGDGVTYTYGT